jgi:hypothetical protein
LTITLFSVLRQFHTAHFILLIRERNHNERFDSITLTPMSTTLFSRVSFKQCQMSCNWHPLACPNTLVWYDEQCVLHACVLQALQWGQFHPVYVTCVVVFELKRPLLLNVLTWQTKSVTKYSVPKHYCNLVHYRK